ncbi:MAG: YkgJ family cysteine cluster protein [Armatimonadota bacterium]
MSWLWSDHYAAPGACGAPAAQVSGAPAGASRDGKGYSITYAALGPSLGDEFHSRREATGVPDPVDNPRAWLRWAYALLICPECDGCTKCAVKCAGPIPLWREEAEALARLAAEQGLVTSVRRPIGEDDPCPFLDTQTRLCQVYTARPLICRAFGLVPWLPCPAREKEAKAKAPRQLSPKAVTLVLEGYTSRPRRTLIEWMRDSKA